MRWTMEFVVLTLAMTAAAWFTGWWSLPVLAAGYGVWAASHKTVVLTAAIAGAASWGALLAYTASQGPAARLSDVSASRSTCRTARSPSSRWRSLPCLGPPRPRSRAACGDSRHPCNDYPAAAPAPPSGYHHASACFDHRGGATSSSTCSRVAKRSCCSSDASSGSAVATCNAPPASDTGSTPSRCAMRPGICATALASTACVAASGSACRRR